MSCMSKNAPSPLAAGLLQGVSAVILVTTGPMKTKINLTPPGNETSRHMATPTGSLSWSAPQIRSVKVNFNHHLIEL